MEKKLIIVTGASRGLGKAICEELVRRDMQPIGLARYPPESLGFPCEALDIRDADSVKSTFERISKNFGSPDGLVNNAGVGIFKTIVNTTAEDFHNLIQTNVYGSFLMIQQTIRAILAHGRGGRIINIGSIADCTAIPENAIYAASKAALKTISAVINEEHTQTNIRSTHLSLGAVATDIWQGRGNFNPNDMLSPLDVARTIADIFAQPLHVRIDEIKMFPPKGLL